MSALIPDILAKVGQFLNIPDHQAAAQVNPLWKKALSQWQSWPPVLHSAWLPFLTRNQLTPRRLQLLRQFRPLAVNLSGNIRTYSCPLTFIPYINWTRVREITLNMQTLTD